MGVQAFPPYHSWPSCVVPISNREEVLKGFHDDIGHWDLKTTRQFITERYWWPTVYADVRDYVKSCHGCQKACPIPKYKTTLRLPISSLFDTFSIDFAGPFPATSSGNRFVLVAVEHLTGWPIAMATSDSTAQVVLKFVKREIMYSFGPPHTIVSDNATCFTASAVFSFMAQHGITWRTVLAYAPMSNGRAERMVGTLKTAVRKTVLETGMEWDKALIQVLYGYRRRALSNGVSPFELMYGVPPRMDPRAEIGASLVVPSSDIHRRLELLAGSVPRAIRSGASEEKRVAVASSHFFRQGEKVLVARGTAFGGTKWPANVSKFYGPCSILEARHPRYVLESRHGRISRKPIHARRLVPYRTRKID